LDDEKINDVQTTTSHVHACFIIPQFPEIQLAIRSTKPRSLIQSKSASGLQKQVVSGPNDGEPCNLHRDRDFPKNLNGVASPAKIPFRQN